MSGSDPTREDGVSGTAIGADGAPITSPDSKESTDPFSATIYDPTDPTLSELATVPKVDTRSSTEIAAREVIPALPVPAPAPFVNVAGVETQIESQLDVAAAAADAKLEPSFDQLAHEISPDTVGEIRREVEKINEGTSPQQLESIAQKIFRALRVEGFPLFLQNGKLAAGDALDGILGTDIPPEVAGVIHQSLIAEAAKQHENGRTLETGPELRRRALFAQIAPKFEEYGRVRGVMSAMGEAAEKIEALDQEFTQYTMSLAATLQDDQTLASRLDNEATIAQATALHLYEKINAGRLKGEDVTKFREARDFYEFDVVSRLVDKHTAKGDLDSATAQLERFLTLEDRGEVVRTSAVVGLADLYKQRADSFPAESEERKQWNARAAELYGNIRDKAGEYATFKLAALHMENGQFTEAVDLYREVLNGAGSPDLEKQARLGLGAALVEAGQYDEGVKHLTDILVKDPANELAAACRERAYLHIAVKSLKESDPSLSDELVARILAGEASSPEAQVIKYRAMLLETIAHVEAAQEEFKRTKEASQQSTWLGSVNNAQATRASDLEIRSSSRLVKWLNSGTGTLDALASEAQSHESEADKKAERLIAMKRARRDSVNILIEAKEHGKAAMALVSEGRLAEALEMFDRAQMSTQAAAEKLVGHKVLIVSDEHQEAMERALYGYESAIKSMDTYEKVARGVRNACVMTAATLATGGIASAGGGMLLSFAGGTAVGSAIGGLSNTGEAVGHIAYGNKSARQAFSDAAKQTLADVKSSAISAISTGPALKLASKLMPAAGAPVSALRHTLVGAVTGGTSATISTTIGTGEGYAYAWSDFNKHCEVNGITDEVVKYQEWRTFLEDRGLAWGDIAQNYAINIGAGLAGGATGGFGNRLAGPQASMARKIAVGAGETVIGGGIEITAASVGGEWTPEQAGAGLAAVAVGNLGSRTVSSVLPEGMTKAIQGAQAKIDAGVFRVTGGRFGKAQVVAPVVVVETAKVADADTAKLSAASDSAAAPGTEPVGTPDTGTSAGTDAGTVTVESSPVQTAASAGTDTVTVQQEIVPLDVAQPETVTSAGSDDVKIQYDFVAEPEVRPASDPLQMSQAALESEFTRLGGYDTEPGVGPENLQVLRGLKEEYTKPLDPVTAELKQALESGANPRTGKTLTEGALKAMRAELNERLSAIAKNVAEAVNAAKVAASTASSQIEVHSAEASIAGTSADNQVVHIEAGQRPGTGTIQDGGGSAIETFTASDGDGGNVTVSLADAPQGTRTSVPVTSDAEVFHTDKSEVTNTIADPVFVEDSVPHFSDAGTEEPVLVGVLADGVVDAEGRVLVPEYETRGASSLPDEAPDAMPEIGPQRGLSGEEIISAAKEFTERLNLEGRMETVQEAAQRLISSLSADEQARIAARPAAQASEVESPVNTKPGVDEIAPALEEVRSFKDEFDATVREARLAASEGDVSRPFLERVIDRLPADFKRKAAVWMAVASSLMPRAGTAQGMMAQSRAVEIEPTPVTYVIEDVRAAANAVETAETVVTPRQAEVSQTAVRVTAPAQSETAPRVRTVAADQNVQITVKPSTIRHLHVVTDTEVAKQQAEEVQQEVQEQVQQQVVVRVQEETQTQKQTQAKAAKDIPDKTKTLTDEMPRPYMPRPGRPGGNRADLTSMDEEARKLAERQLELYGFDGTPIAVGGPDAGRRVRSKRPEDLATGEMTEDQAQIEESKDA